MEQLVWKENIILNVYDKYELLNSDIVEDFCSKTRIEIAHLD